MHTTIRHRSELEALKHLISASTNSTHILDLQTVGQQGPTNLIRNECSLKYTPTSYEVSPSWRKQFCQISYSKRLEAPSSISRTIVIYVRAGHSFQTLTTLDLTRDRIGAVGIEHLATALGVNHVSELFFVLCSRDVNGKIITDIQKTESSDECYRYCGC